jgi:hypothetical protein
MSDFMLRTNTQDEMDDALIAAGLAQEATDPDGEVNVQAVSGVAIDHIGPIPAQLDPEDPSVILKPGDARWHTNLRVTVELTQEQVAALPTFAPTPGIPYRVFI